MAFYKKATDSETPFWPMKPVYDKILSEKRDNDRRRRHPGALSYRRRNGAAAMT